MRASSIISRQGALKIGGKVQYEATAKVGDACKNMETEKRNEWSREGMCRVGFIWSSSQHVTPYPFARVRTRRHKILTNHA
jgi:hypothetical protein